MSLSTNISDLLRVDWFEMEYRCPRCAEEWSDQWTCPCNDRCPECNLESSPVTFVDLSRSLEREDYEYAARRVAALGSSPKLEGIPLPEITQEQAKQYAEARLEGN